MSRAERISHKIRLKKKRMKYHSGAAGPTVWETPQVCSCHMCGNKRKYLGKTRQELRHEDVVES